MRGGFGRGLMRLPFNDHLGYGHGSTIDDFRAMASYFPNEKLPIALCSNSGPRPIDDALVGALSIYFGRPYKIPDFAPSTYLPTMTKLDHYAGLYTSAQFPLKITVTHEGPVHWSGYISAGTREPRHVQVRLGKHPHGVRHG